MVKKLALVLSTLAVALLAAVPAAFAEETGPAASAAGITDNGLIALASGLAISLAAFGGALGQSRAAASALEGMARNPSAAGTLQTAMIIGLALIESLVIYAFVIAIMLQGNIG